MKRNIPLKEAEIRISLSNYLFNIGYDEIDVNDTFIDFIINKTPDFLDTYEGMSYDEKWKCVSIVYQY